VVADTSNSKSETRGSYWCTVCNVVMVIKLLLADGVGVKLAGEGILYLYQARSVMGQVKS
jgi:hypothetical protein